MNVTVKMPPKMKEALEDLARREFTSVSGLLKKAAEKYLQENRINWRGNEEEKPTQRKQGRQKR